MSEQTASLAREFDFLYRKVYDRLKTIELTLPLLGDRIDAEDKLSKAYEKISSSFPKQGGDFDDLLQGLRVDLSTRCSYNKQFKQSFQTDLDSITQAMKNVHHQIKPMVSEVEKIDKDVKVQNEKLEKTREKYVKASKENEDIILSVQATEWNKEAPPDFKEKLLQKVNNTQYAKQESEAQYNAAIQSLSQTLTQANNQYLLFNNKLRQLFNEEFASFKDLSLKMLVYEISRQRNQQYDTEQFFKEVEKYACSVDIKNIPLDYKAAMNTACLKVPPVPLEFVKYNSYLTNISRQIQQTSKLLQHNRPKVEPQRELSDIEFLVLDPTFNQAFTEIIQDMIKIAHNRKKISDIKDPSQEPSSDKQEKTDKTEKTPEIADQKTPADPPDLEEKLSAPLNPLQQHRQSISKKKTYHNMITHFITQFNSVHPDKLFQLLALIKFIVEQSVGEPVAALKDIKSEVTIEQFREQIQKKYVKEISVITLEQFRISSCVSLSKVGYKQFVSIADELLKSMKSEIPLIKRLLLIVVTIYKVQDGQKIYLSDGIITSEIWTSQDLWFALIYTAIDEEFQKNQNQATQQKFDREQIFKDKNTIFQTVLSLTANMLSFKLDRAFVKGVVAKTSSTYALYELQTNELMNFIENDGKIDPQSKFSSTSVLQSLFQNKTETVQQIQNQKKVVLFNAPPQPQSVIVHSQKVPILVSPATQKFEQVQSPAPKQEQKEQKEQKDQTQKEQKDQIQMIETEQKQDKKPNYKSHPLERFK